MDFGTGTFAQGLSRAVTGEEAYPAAQMYAQNFLQPNDIQLQMNPAQQMGRPDANGPMSQMLQLAGGLGGVTNAGGSQYKALMNMPQFAGMGAGYRSA